MLASWLIEPLQFGFIQRALLVSVLAGIVCALLSCWITLIGWSLLGDAVSHAVLPGVVLAYMFAVPFSLGALLFGGIAVTLIGTVRETTRLKGDTSIGVVFTALFALGLVLVSRAPTQVDLDQILFGNVLGVTDADILQVVVISAVVLAVVTVKQRDLTLYAFDPTHAHAIGLNPRRIGALLLAMLAFTVVAAIQAVGVILVTAMLITPGATAFLLTRRLPRMLVLATGIATISSVLGTYLSFYLDVATGAMVVLCQAGLFLCATLFAPGQGLVARTFRRGLRTTTTT